MKVTIEKEEKDFLSFTLEGVEPSFANAIRRTSLSRVRTFAITSVVIYENTSSLFDEFLAHRIGQIPLTTPKDYDPEEEVILKLDKQGPCTVYSKDLETTDARILPALETIPIIKLAEGQTIRLEAKAKVGTGYMHARWQPCLCSYDVNENGVYSFFVESFHMMDAKRIVREAGQVLLAKARELEQKL